MATGQLKLGQIKLGDNADESKNFVIKTPTIADGTLTIERGNGTDVLTIDASGNVAFPSMPGFGTSPIIESGSNANGEYTKFTDGTMICSYTLPSAAYAVTTPSGSVYRTASIQPARAYPASFITTPKCNSWISGGGGGRWICAETNATSTTWPSYYILGSVSSSTNSPIDFLAIGRWK